MLHSLSRRVLGAGMCGGARNLQVSPLRGKKIIEPISKIIIVVNILASKLSFSSLRADYGGRLSWHCWQVSIHTKPGNYNNSVEPATPLYYFSLQ